MVTLALVLVAVGCGGGGRGALDAGPRDAGSGDHVPAPVATNKVDLLFVLDNSNGGDMPVRHLQAGFDSLMAPLLSFDLHLAIVTTDLGAGQFTPPSCYTLGGDQGRLQNTPLGRECESAHLVDAEERFLKSSGIGETPETNFTGELGEAFGCYAALGAGGCGFEHVLGSMRAALEGCEVAGGCGQPDNEGFLRGDAVLAVIIATDEDDCSAPASSKVFDPTQTSIRSELGPLTSYRCFEFGVLCGGEDVGRQQGPREECVAGSKSSDSTLQLVPVERYAVALRRLKPDPDMIYVAMIAPPPEPVEVGLDPNGNPDVQPACRGAYGACEAGIRLHAFLSLFHSTRSRFVSHCAPDDDTLIGAIGDDIAAMLAPP